MTTVKVIGAGSIGNHLAHGCRQKGWDVTIVDLSPEALTRTRDTIYPARYGNWDESITLAKPAEVDGKPFDIVIIGTPPATHLGVASAELLGCPPQVMLIEKPLCQPDAGAISDFLKLAATSPTRVLVGYNQRKKPCTEKFVEVARNSGLGQLQALSSRMLESWDGILQAHFWMADEKDSYLAFTDQGGGALLEHSHALNLMLHFATELGQGDPIAVDATINWIDHESGRYDNDTFLRVTLESGLIAEVQQDLTTWPASKQAIASFENGAVVWNMGDSADSVQLLNQAGDEKQRWNFPKTRPDDFSGEIAHLGALLGETRRSSSLDLDNGVRVMEVALTAIESARAGTKTPILRLGPEI